MSNEVIVGEELDRLHSDLLSHIKNFTTSVKSKELSLVTSGGVYQLGWLDAFRLFLEQYKEDSSPTKKMIVSSLYRLNKTCPWAIPLYFNEFFKEGSYKLPSRAKRIGSEQLLRGLKHCGDHFIMENADVLWQAVYEAGSTGSLSLEPHCYDNTSIEVHNGFRTVCDLNSFFYGHIPTGEIRDCRIIVVDGAIIDVSEIHHVLEYSYDSKSSVVIIARSFSEDVSNTLFVNWESGKTNVIGFTLPDSLETLNEIKDVCTLMGSTPISASNGLRINNIIMDELAPRDIFYDKERSTLRLLLDQGDLWRLKKSKSELEKKYDNETDTDVREILASRISRMSSRTVVVRSKLLESEKGIFSDRAGAFFSYFSRCASQGVVPANEDCLVDYLPYSDADLAIRMASYDRKSINNIKAVLRLEDENE